VGISIHLKRKIPIMLSESQKNYMALYTGRVFIAEMKDRPLEAQILIAEMPKNALTLSETAVLMKLMTVPLNINPCSS
jgi:hypothetical protein